MTKHLLTYTNMNPHKLLVLQHMCFVGNRFSKCWQQLYAIHKLFKV